MYSNRIAFYHGLWKSLIVGERCRQFALEYLLEKLPDYEKNNDNTEREVKKK